MTLRSQRGFTLIEVMIVMSLALVILGATLTSFTNFERKQKQSPILNDSAQVARNSMDHASRQLRNLAQPGPVAAGDDDRARAAVRPRVPDLRPVAQVGPLLPRHDGRPAAAAPPRPARSCGRPRPPRRRRRPRGCWAPARAPAGSPAQAGRRQRHQQARRARPAGVHVHVQADGAARPARRAPPTTRGSRTSARSCTSIPTRTRRRPSSASCRASTCATRTRSRCRASPRAPSPGPRAP